jgi:hypothetical protein
MPQSDINGGLTSIEHLVSHEKASSIVILLECVHDLSEGIRFVLIPGNDIL